MHTRYFRLKVPKYMSEEIEWIEMTGKEFYRFVKSPEGQGRHFIDMGDVVLESTEIEAREYKAEQNHRYYIQAQEDGWNTLSIYTVEDENGCSGEDVVKDDSQDVEAEVIMRIERKALRAALYQLDHESRLLIQALYFADERKTERELAQERGVSQVAIHKMKKKILETIKLLVIKFQKSQQ